MLTSAALALSLVLAAQANPAAVLQQSGVTAEAGEPMPLHFWGGLTHSVGAGTFVTGPTNNPNVSTTLSLVPNLIYKGWVVGVSQRIGIEYTQGDFTTRQGQLELADTVLTVRYNGFRLPDLNLLFSLSGNYAVPISLASRHNGSAGTFSGGGRATWLKQDIGLAVYGALSGGYTQLVPSLAGREAPGNVYQDRSLGAVRPQVCNPRAEGETQNYLCNDGFLPSIFSWGPATGVTWMTFDGVLTFAFDFAYRQAVVAFYGPDDQYRADAARTGYGLRQFTSTNLAASWSPTAWFSLTGGLSTFQPVFRGDGVTPRFPLWDIHTTRDNWSSLYVDTTFSL